MAWWRDRAFQRNPTSRAFATGPASRRAAKPPSHRADEPPSAQAPGIRAPLVRTDPKDRSRRAPRMRSQDSAVSRLSPPLIAHSLARLAICSGQSHPGLQTQPQPVRHRLESHRSRALRPPGRYGRVRPVRDSPSDVATCHRVVPTGTQAPIIQSDPAIGVTDTSASRAWVHVGQPAPKTALKASHKALYRPEECLGSHGARPRQRGLVTNRHKSSCHVTILRFWPAISEPGWARRKKVSLGVLLRRTRPSHGRVCRSLHPAEARQNIPLAGLYHHAAVPCAMYVPVFL